MVEQLWENKKLNLYWFYNFIRILLFLSRLTHNIIISYTELMKTNENIRSENIGIPKDPPYSSSNTICSVYL